MPTISIREKKGRNCSPPKPPPTSSRGRRPPPLSDLLFLVRWLWHGGESRQHGCVSGGATPRTPPHVGRSQVKGFRRCMHGGCRAASPTRPRGPIAGSLCNWDRRRGRQSFVYCIACWDVRWGSGRRRGRPSSSSASLAPLRRRGLHDVIPNLGVGRTRLAAGSLRSSPGWSARSSDCALGHGGGGIARYKIRLLFRLLPMVAIFHLLGVLLDVVFQPSFLCLSYVVWSIGSEAGDKVRQKS
jgi:hypothetical protein